MVTARVWVANDAGEQELGCEFRLVGGKVRGSSEPGYETLTATFAGSKMFVDDESTAVTAEEAPERWLQALPFNLNGIRIRAELVEEPEDLSKAGNGVMIAWFPPPEIAQELAVGSESPEELHVTLGYFGKEVTAEQQATLEAICSSCSAQYAPLQGELGGVGRFPATESSDGKDVIILLADVPRLETLRERLLDALHEQGVDAYRNHGYTPHMTLAYIDPGAEFETPNGNSLPITIDALTLAIGGERLTFPFNGQEVLKGEPGVSDVHVDRPLGDAHKEPLAILPAEDAETDDEEPVEKKLEDAPHYREAVGNEPTCSICVHGGDGYCDLYSGNYSKGWRCDDHELLVKRYEKYTPPVKVSVNARAAFGRYEGIGEEVALIANKLANGTPLSEEDLRAMRDKMVDEIEDADWYALGGRAGLSWATRVLRLVEKDRGHVALVGEITKVDADKRLVFGWASVVKKAGKSVHDRQGDIISEPDMETMAMDFVSGVRKMGLMHETIGGGELVESMAFTRDKQSALGIDLGKVGWWVGFRVTDDSIWKRVKSGELRSFSIHGKGIRTRL